MKMETFKNDSKETFVTGHELIVTCNTWANLEGLNVLAMNKDLSIRMAAAFRWEELDVLLVALSAARSPE